MKSSGILKIFIVFWFEMTRNLMAADLVSVFDARQLFFCESTSFYHIFLILRLK
jgi:hypothetical protein